MNSNIDLLTNVFILLAPGFEEGAAIYCVDRLRESGLPVSLVSLSSGLVNSKHGVAIKPDRMIDDIKPNESKSSLLIIPGGTKSTASLLTDPRTHRLLKQHQGFLAAMETAVPLLDQFNIPEAFSSRFIPKCPEQGVTQFSQELIKAIIQ